LVFGTFVAVSQGILLIGDFVKKYHKIIGIIFIILLIALGGYYQIKSADAIIKNKIPSFGGIREASLFVKEISSPEDIIISQAVPQTIYYSERKVMEPGRVAGAVGDNFTFESFLEKIKDFSEAKYFLVSFSEPNYPIWAKRQTTTFWEIPFMDTNIDFTTGQQNIKQEKTYGNITFKLIALKQDVFIYEIKYS
ncbi:MAG: hypothetical protein Q8O84_04140, partial [Nanoarchaeota archaeon]|nr:hypothetical protein [Nanoarchaeota archaeon]